MESGKEATALFLPDLFPSARFQTRHQPPKTPFGFASGCGLGTGSNPASRSDAIRRIDTRPRLGHIGSMSAIAKSRIDPELKRQAEAVLEEIGLKPRAALELFYKQIIKRRAIPFPVQADSPEDDILSLATRRNQLADEF